MSRSLLWTTILLGVHLATLAHSAWAQRAAAPEANAALGLPSLDLLNRFGSSRIGLPSGGLRAPTAWSADWQALRRSPAARMPTTLPGLGAPTGYSGVPPILLTMRGARPFGPSLTTAFTPARPTGASGWVPATADLLGGDLPPGITPLFAGTPPEIASPFDPAAPALADFLAELASIPPSSLGWEGTPSARSLDQATGLALAVPVLSVPGYGLPGSLPPFSSLRVSLLESARLGWQPTPLLRWEPPGHPLGASQPSSPAGFPPGSILPY